MSSLRPPQPKQSDFSTPSVAGLLATAKLLKTPEELQELVEGILAIRTRRVAPAASEEESSLLFRINEALPIDLANRLKELQEKQIEESLSPNEHAELLTLATEIERRGVERLEALSDLAAVRGVTLSELMRTLGITAWSGDR